ncbi:MAG: Na/Pi cotransporter family protein [bacterium]|nr:Na/Pi cotransporter family protein [bacterium]
MQFRPFRGTRRHVCGIVVVAALLVSLTGCSGKVPPKPDRVSLFPHASGNDQCGMYGQELAKPLQAVVEGARERGMLGGKGSRRSCPGIEVRFRVVEPAHGAVFADNGLPEYVASTNEAGVAAARLILGELPGDVNVVASAVDVPEPNNRVTFRARTGVELIGAGLEGPTGGVIDAFGVRLQDPSGAPSEGVRVAFRVLGDAHGAKVGGRDEIEVATDSEGRAVVPWRLGDDVQVYSASVEIVDDRPSVPVGQRYRGRSIEFRAMATDKLRMVIDLMGGLALFILGMRWMSGGLRRMADRRLKSILQTVTRNRVLGSMVGAGLTAVVQSSSATTVMAVGFVNAGLLTLHQSIGVIYGASVGTTITAQIIAFKLNTLAFPAIAIGLIMSAASKRVWVKSLGEAVLGFGLLFLGLTLMADVLKPLRHSPEFQTWFQMFDCSPEPGGLIKAWPAFMCILIGTFTTVIVQSSSATVGLVLVLASQGLVGFHTAVPLVLGDNIGTTITAILASLGTNRNAKRAALAHALFKIFGAAYMYVFLFIPLWNGHPIFLGFIDYITPGDVFAPVPVDVQRHIANAHTAFNVINLLLFLPFVGAMERLCRKIIPVTAADQERILEYLEPHLLQAPSIALQQSVKEVAYMVKRAQKSINEACAFFLNGSTDLEDKILAREELIDRLQSEITAYLVDLSRRDLSPEEATLLPALIHAVNDAERIGDHSENLLELAHLKKDGKFTLSHDAVDHVKRLEELLNRQFDATLLSLTDGGGEHVDEVLEAEEQVTTLMAEAAEAHVLRLEAGQCSVQAGVIFLDVMAHLERVGDHLTNIAERAGRVTQVTQP